MESPQFSSVAIPTSNGTSLDTAHPATTESSFSLGALVPSATSTTAAIKSTPSTPPVSPKVVQNLTTSHISKLPSLAPQTKLTGEAALANRHQGQSQSPSRRGVMSNDSGSKGGDSGKTLETSPNPASILTGYPISRPGDAPAQETSPTSQKVLGSIASAANAMNTSGSTTSGAVTSTSSNGSSGEPTATAGPTNATDPSLLQPHNDSNQPYQAISPIQQMRAGSISEQLSATTPTTPGFSATTPTTPFSPSATTPGGSRGKHTCPHCNQTFTRHHNLKSHLLTHSQEKPFLCNICQARFRRLHDLKRHSKLHTGERPHVCHKCGRKFARGDALARHARAEGGCAGRRSSMAGVSEDGSMGPGLPGDNDDGMEGLEGLMDGDPDGDVDMIGGSDGNGSRRRSLPSIRTDFSTGSQNPVTVQGGNPITPASGYTPNQHHNTYPPLGTPNRTASTSGPSPASGTGLFPPHLSAKTNVNTPTSASSMQTSATTVPTPTPTSGGAGGGPTGSILSPHRGLTASPRDVSPAAIQSQEASGGSERNSTFTFMTGLQPSSQQQQQQQQLQAQQKSAGAGAGGAPTANMGGNTNMFTQGIDGVWGYMKELEDRVKSLESMVEGLRAELRKHNEQTGQQRQESGSSC